MMNEKKFCLFVLYINLHEPKCPVIFHNRDRPCWQNILTVKTKKYVSHFVYITAHDRNTVKIQKRFRHKLSRYVLFSAHVLDSDCALHDYRYGFDGHEQ